MSIAAIIKLIREIFALGRLIESLYVQYENHQLRKVEKRLKQTEAANRALNRKIEAEAAKEKPNEDAIKDLHRRVTRINANKL